MWDISRGIVALKEFQVRSHHEPLGVPKNPLRLSPSSFQASRLFVSLLKSETIANKMDVFLSARRTGRLYEHYLELRPGRLRMTNMTVAKV